MPITPAQIREWTEACEKATQGPWFTYGGLSVYYRETVVVGNITNQGDYDVAEAETDPDARFIAHARTALPLLLAERKRWEEGLRRIAEDRLLCHSDPTPQEIAANLLAGREWDGLSDESRRLLDAGIEDVKAGRVREIQPSDLEDDDEVR